MASFLKKAFAERFADYFVICGLDESDGLVPHKTPDSGEKLLTPFQISYEPSILWHYPENEPTNQFEGDGIKVLCMPRGVYFRKSQRRTATHFHSFLQTREDATKIYGFVLTFFERVTNEKIVVAMDTLFKMFDNECVLVSKPAATDKAKSPRNKKLERQNRAKSVYSFKKDKDENLYVSKSICLVMKKPFVSLARQWLLEILHLGCNEANYSLPVESYIYNILYEIPSPPPGRTMSYTTIQGEPIVINNPHKEDLPFFDYSMKEVLETLGLENLVDLFTCMLLEHQILLLSSDSHKLMLIAESLTTLFFPLLWQHVYVPVLPPFLMHYLDAPVPFIMGMCYETEQEKDMLELPLESSLCLLDIDHNAIHLPQEIPELPVRKELIKELHWWITTFDIQVRKGSLMLKGMSAFEEPETECDSPHGGTWPRKKLDLCKKQPSPIMGRRKSAVPQQTNWAGEQSPSHHNEVKSKKASSSSHLAAIVKIVENAGVRTSDIIGSKGGEPTNYHVLGDRTITCTRLEQHKDEINIIVREIFVNCFTQMLVDYEHFIILPQQSKEDWIANRDQMQNFDKAAFLSDQKQLHLPFMTLFVETQGFASLIDMKIMALWEECNPRLSYFDKRVDKLKVRLGIARNPNYEKCMTINSSIESYIKRTNHIDHTAIQPHALKCPISRETTPGFFPIPDENCLNESQKSKSKRSVDWRKRDKQRQQNEHLNLNEKINAKEGAKIQQNMAERLKKYIIDTKSTNQQDAVIGATQRTLNVYAERLLKECKTKTKSLVVLKLGQEAVELGHVGTHNAGIEENTLIASLCDLLERVWCHGVEFRQLDFDKHSEQSKFVQRMNQSKSPLWAHLLAFYQKDCERLAAVYGLPDVKNVPDDMRQIIIEANSSSRKMSTVDTWTGSLSRVIRNRNPDSEVIGQLMEETTPSSLPSTPTMPGLKCRQQEDLLARITFLHNLKTVLEMQEIKTDTGYARAWTRLALEKKTLATEIRILLSHKKVLENRYRDYSFIRTDEEMEQFSFHLLSLNAVDFYCFTNGFTNTTMTYKFNVVIGRNIGSASTSNCWINLTGSYGNTGIIKIPRGELGFRFKHKNLGILTALRIGHDNMGISPGWFVEMVVVGNEITGLMYKFECGRWLSKSNDDGSTERLLIASMINPKAIASNKPVSSSLTLAQRSSPSTSPVRKPSPTAVKKVTASDIQEKVADAVNSIVKYYYNNNDENMTFLMCGEGGFCKAMDRVFKYGFKSKRLFSKSLFIWDYIIKVFDECIYKEIVEEVRSSFCTTVQTINTAQLSIGKEQKFELLVCLGLRDHNLQAWFRLLHTSPVTMEMYEPWSFFRYDPHLDFLVDVLDSLKEFDISLDKTVTRGI